MAGLTFKNITKVYDNKVTAVSDFSMDIQDREFIVFVGPSGCGKSTLLRMIAGLEEITSGELYIDERKVNDVEPKDRDVSMVFQNYALYPHMTVYQNIAFPLRMRKMPKDEIRTRVEYVAKILDIDKYLDRKPKALSGGQRQRVALGRAIVRQPKVYLLDEPLSNLDAKLRASMRTEISKLHEELQITFIYVTHDQVEAMTMGTRIVVLKDGLVQQIASPTEIYAHPRNKFVASFIGTPQMNFYDARLSPDGTVTFAAGNQIKLPANRLAQLPAFSESRPVILGVRPEDIHLSEDADALQIRTRLVEELGSEKILHGSFRLEQESGSTLDSDPMDVMIKLTGKESVSRGTVRGFCFDTECIHLFDPDTEQNLFSEV